MSDVEYGDDFEDLDDKYAPDFEVESDADDYEADFEVRCITPMRGIVHAIYSAMLATCLSARLVGGQQRIACHHRCRPMRAPCLATTPRAMAS